MGKLITPTGGKPNSGKNDVKTSPFQVGRSGPDWFPPSRPSGPGFIGGGAKVPQAPKSGLGKKKGK